MNEKFDEAIKQVTQWIESYSQEVENYPVLSPVSPGEISEQLPDQAPFEAEDFDQIFQDFKNIIVPGITHWQHPSFFGYFPSNSSPPSILAEMLVAAMGVQCMSWATSPAATELELKMMVWLRDLLGLPSEFSGVIYDSASQATMAAMIVARERASDFTIRERGFSGNSLVAYCSSEAHSSIEKASGIIGIGRENLRKIPVDEQQRMKVCELEKAVKEDLALGKQPFFVVGAFGTTGSTSVDALDELSRVAKKYQMWFHVDAAYAGAALALPEIRPLGRGIEKADSFVMNPHKWLLTTFDCSAFYVRHPQALVRTFSILPEYLKTPEGDSVANLRDWGLGLGRRFRSLKLWFVLRWYGVEGIRSLLKSHIALGEKFESLVASDHRFEIMAPRHFNVVCFRLKQSDEANQALLERVNKTGKMFITHTKINGKLTLRMVIGQTHVKEHHIQEAWKLLRD